MAKAAVQALHDGFAFSLPIMRAIPDEVQRNIVYIECWASDTSLDAAGSRMTPDCIIGYVNCVNDGTPVPVINPQAPDTTRSLEVGNPTGFVGVDNEHSEHWQDQIGYAVEAQAIYEVPDFMRAAGLNPE